MAILKKFTQAFTQTPNDILNRSDLSLKAKGLWTFLNSKPEGWNFSVNGIKSQNKDGKESVTSGLKELENNRYLKRVANQEKDGKFNGYNYLLFDEPFVEPTDDVKPAIGEHSNHSNKDLSKKEISNKNESLFPGEEIKPLQIQILEYLNEKKKSKIPFKPTTSNLKDIKARLNEKYQLKEFFAVIDLKVSQWSDSDKMKRYIRPSTLFGEKFGSYLEETSHGTTSKNDGSNNFKLNQQQTATML